MVTEAIKRCRPNDDGGGCDGEVVALMIGDSINDIKAGAAAGALTCLLLSHGDSPRRDDEEAALLADYVINSLSELIPIINDISFPK